MRSFTSCCIAAGGRLAMRRDRNDFSFASLFPAEIVSKENDLGWEIEALDDSGDTAFPKLHLRHCLDGVTLLWMSESDGQSMRGIYVEEGDWRIEDLADRLSSFVLPGHSEAVQGACLEALSLETHPSKLVIILDDMAGDLLHAVVTYWLYAECAVVEYCRSRVQCS